MLDCLANLPLSDVWEELKSIPPEAIIEVYRLASFDFERTPVYASPDLIYHPAADRLVIVDWKTGSEEGVDFPIGVYALYARDSLGLPFREGGWMGRVINLATVDDTYLDITLDDLDRDRSDPQGVNREGAAHGTMPRRRAASSESCGAASPRRLR